MLRQKFRVVASRRAQLSRQHAVVNLFQRHPERRIALLNLFCGPARGHAPTSSGCAATPCFAQKLRRPVRERLFRRAAGADSPASVTIVIERFP